MLSKIEALNISPASVPIIEQSLRNFPVLAKKLIDILEKDLNNASLWFNLGLLYFLNNDYISAIKIMEQTVKVNPSNAKAWSIIGYIALEEKKWIVAVQAYLNITNIHSCCCSSWNNLGFAYSFAQAPLRAEESFRTALTFDPQNVITLANLGCLCAEQKRFKEAEQFFNKVLVLDADNWMAHNSLEAIQLEASLL